MFPKSNCRLETAVRLLPLYGTSLMWEGKKVNQSRYRPGVAQRVPGS